MGGSGGDKVVPRETGGFPGFGGSPGLVRDALGDSPGWFLLSVSHFEFLVVRSPGEEGVPR